MGASAAFGRCANLDFCHLPYQHRHALAHDDRRVSDVLGFKHTTDAMNQVFLAALGVKARRSVLVGVAQRLYYLVEGQSICSKAFGLNDNLVLLGVAAYIDHFSHARHGQQTTPQHPIGGGLEFNSVVLIRCQGDEQNFAHHR